ncbi:uncharacterized protein FOMMEDRAFT_27374 [Fomitiporia mediterranea MF3/22]|uniref:uncharacterized protein n=1 Tax=Fomitiporia mediterranea (strain MF3/22) TaxID=694068 RepID=UPI0004409AA7|nr:uncharacterized protein FOMMEDRAFT_27374 [Fomitiporia mediterranea MF3/22]EJD05183.1 hypothetical protein FOMMEDRAFT_27374 [Fomitiporia mediterranea MF3/22]
MSNYPLNSIFNRPECRRFDINVHFKTYSDARLAALFLDNMHKFSTRLFEQIFDVVTDPRFKSSDVTLTGLWEIFDQVSTYRRGTALDRGVAKPPEIKKSSGVVPPVILGLVVDAIVQNDLYLKHFEWPGIESEEERTLVWCDTLQYLYECIPRMLSLKFLTIEGWSSSETDVLDWNEHPPSSLKAVDLMLGSLGTDMSGQIVAWLLRPRGNFSLQSLSICGGEYLSEDTCEELGLLLQTSLQLEQLSVYSTPALDEVLLDSRVPSLDLFYNKINWDVHMPCLPSSLEHLGIHITERDAHEMCTNWVNFICPLIEKISILPGLRTLVFIIRAEDSYVDWKLICNGLDSRFYRRSLGTSGLADEPLPVELTKFCEGRNIHLACVNAASLG